MTKRNSILCVLILCGTCLAGTPSDSCVKKFIQYLDSTRYLYAWEHYPLTKFPYLKAQHLPWQVPCVDGYVYVVGEGNIACTLQNGTCYIGTKCLMDSSLYMYRAESYSYDGKKWKFLEDYVIVTSLYGDVLGVHKRNQFNGDYEKVRLYAQ